MQPYHWYASTSVNTIVACWMQATDQYTNPCGRSGFHLYVCMPTPRQSELIFIQKCILLKSAVRVCSLSAEAIGTTVPTKSARRQSVTRILCILLSAQQESEAAFCIDTESNFAIIGRQPSEAIDRLAKRLAFFSPQAMLAAGNLEPCTPSDALGQSKLPERMKKMLDRATSPGDGPPTCVARCDSEEPGAKQFGEDTASRTRFYFKPGGLPDDHDLGPVDLDLFMDKYFVPFHHAGNDCASWIRKRSNDKSVEWRRIRQVTLDHCPASPADAILEHCFVEFEVLRIRFSERTGYLDIAKANDKYHSVLVLYAADKPLGSWNHL